MENLAKRGIKLLVIFVGILCLPFLASAARSSIDWVNPSTTSYIQPNFPSGMDLLIVGSNHYVNFNSVTGSSGYGFRDNSGIMEFKNSGGNWTGVGTGGSGSGAGTWSTTTSSVAGHFINYPNNTTDVVVIGASGTSSANYYFDPNINQSFLKNASTTNLSATVFCLTGDVCRSTWPTGSLFPFTATSWGVSTSTTVGFTNGLMSMASSTFTGAVLNTNQWQASSTVLFGSSVIHYASTTLQNFTGVNATTTNATTTSFAVSGLTPNMLVADNGIGGLVSTSTIGNNQLQNSSLTVNSVSISLGGTQTITAASSTLLANNNTFSGSDLFSGVLSASSTVLLTNGFTAYASSTLQNITAQAATFISAPTFSSITGSTQCLHVDTNGLVSGTASDCGSSGGSGTVNSGTQGQVAYYVANGTAVSGTPIIGYASSTNHTTLFGLGTGGQSATTSSTQADNTAFGFNVLRAVSSATHDTGFGASALKVDASGGANSAFGYNALIKTTGTSNDAFGSVALQNVTTGNNNSGFGVSALNNLVSGSQNVAVGQGALLAETGSDSVGLGYNAGSNITSGGFNIILGSFVQAPSVSASGQLNIGNLLYGSGLYQTESGSSVAVTGGTIGIGTTTPFATLSLTGATTKEPFAISTTTATLASSTLFMVDRAGNVHYGGGTPVLSSCGTAPTLGSNSTDQSGTITFGSVASGCTLTFSVAKASAPHCIVTAQSLSLTNALSYTETATALTLTEASSDGLNFDYFCPLGH